jgi:hypothetical protein
LTGALQVIGGNEVLAAAFQQEYSLSSLISELLVGFDVDMDSIKKSDNEKLQDKQKADAARKAAAEGGGPGGGAPTGPGARGGQPIPRQPKI